MLSFADEIDFCCTRLSPTNGRNLPVLLKPWIRCSQEYRTPGKQGPEPRLSNFLQGRYNLDPGPVSVALQSSPMPAMY